MIKKFFSWLFGKKADVVIADTVTTPTVAPVVENGPMLDDYHTEATPKPPRKRKPRKPKPKVEAVKVEVKTDTVVKKRRPRKPKVAK